MSDLESRYRAVLNWYPSAWQEQNADVVLGTLMDEAEAQGRSAPRWSELLSLRAYGIRARVAGIGLPGAEARSRIASFAFGTGFAILAIMFFGEEWTPFDIYRFVSLDAAPFGPFRSASVTVNILWAVAFVFAIAGSTRWARWFLVVTIAAATLSILLINISPVLYLRPPASAMAFLIGLALLSLVGQMRVRATLVAALSSAVFFGIILITQYRANAWTFGGAIHSGWETLANGWWGIGLFILAALLVAVRRTEWVAPVTILAVAFCLLSLGTGLFHRPDFAVICAALIAITVAIATIAVAALGASGYRLTVIKRR